MGTIFSEAPLFPIEKFEQFDSDKIIEIEERQTDRLWLLLTITYRELQATLITSTLRRKILEILTIRDTLGTVVVTRLYMVREVTQ